jgi:hypothetical protein
LISRNFICIIIVLIILLGSCDPRSSKDIYISGSFKLSVTIISPQDSINLGDSVCFVFEVPDTIVINGDKINPFYGNNDGCTFPVSDCKMDTTFGGEDRPFTPDCDTYAIPGSTQGGITLGRSGNNKLISKYYLIPRKKGVYFLWLQQSGYFDANNGTIKARVSYTFDVQDKHHTLLINTARPKNRQSFAAFIQDSENRGLPIYGFAVR